MWKSVSSISAGASLGALLRRQKVRVSCALVPARFGVINADAADPVSVSGHD